MKVTIIDRAVLASVPSGGLAAWLRATGWALVRTEPDRLAIYERPSSDGDAFEVLVPLRSDLRDYHLRIGEALATLAEAEGRAQLDVLRDVMQAQTDVVRIALDGPSTGEGSIALDAGARVFAHARDLMLAAACASIDPRTVWATRKPAQATDYLRALRFGPTERGSFVLTVESPVTPGLLHTPDASDGDVPFERRVTRTLARALGEARNAAALALASGDAQPFLDAVPRGVNANLCEALAGLLREGERATTIRIGWASSRPERDAPRASWAFTVDQVPLLREASRIYREIAPRPDVEVEGMVVQLSREPPAAGGSITLAAVVDGAVRRIRVELGAAEYALAIRAHTEGTRLYCEGELVREGRGFLLRAPRQVSLRGDA